MRGRLISYRNCTFLSSDIFKMFFTNKKCLLLLNQLNYIVHIILIYSMREMVWPSIIIFLPNKLVINNDWLI